MRWLIIVFALSIITGYLISSTPRKEAQKFSAPDKIPDEVSLDIPAMGVDKFGEGVVAYFHMKFKKGNGEIFIETSNHVFALDFQESVIRAKKCAEKLAEQPLRYNVYITVSGVGDQVSGPSASAQIASAIYAQIKNTQIKEKQVATGNIIDTCEINPVLSVDKKAIAAASEGFTHFYIPRGEDVNSQELSDALDINVIEVSDLNQLVNQIVK